MTGGGQSVNTYDVMKNLGIPDHLIVSSSGVGGSATSGRYTAQELAVFAEFGLDPGSGATTDEFYSGSTTTTGSTVDTGSLETAYMSGYVSILIDDPGAEILNVEPGTGTGNTAEIPSSASDVFIHFTDFEDDEFQKLFNVPEEFAGTLHLPAGYSVEEMRNPGGQLTGYKVYSKPAATRTEANYIAVIPLTPGASVEVRCDIVEHDNDGDPYYTYETDEGHIVEVGKKANPDNPYSMAFDTDAYLDGQGPGELNDFINNDDYVAPLGGGKYLLWANFGTLLRKDDGLGYVEDNVNLNTADGLMTEAGAIIPHNAVNTVNVVNGTITLTNKTVLVEGQYHGGSRTLNTGVVTAAEDGRITVDGGSDIENSGFVNDLAGRHYHSKCTDYVGEARDKGRAEVRLIGEDSKDNNIGLTILPTFVGVNTFYIEGQGGNDLDVARVNFSQAVSSYVYEEDRPDLDVLRGDSVRCRQIIHIHESTEMAKVTLGSGGKGVPHVKDGKLVGYYVYGLKEGTDSIYEELGYVSITPVNIPENLRDVYQDQDEYSVEEWQAHLESLDMDDVNRDLGAFGATQVEFLYENDLYQLDKYQNIYEAAALA